MTTMKRFTDLFLGSGPRMSFSLTSNGHLEGKRGNCFFDFVRVQRDFAQDLQSRTISNTS